MGGDDSHGIATFYTDRIEYLGGCVNDAVRAGGRKVGGITVGSGERHRVVLSELFRINGHLLYIVLFGRLARRWLLCLYAAENL